MKKAISLLTVAIMVIFTFALTVSAAGPAVIWDFTDSANALIYNADGTYLGSGTPNNINLAYDATEKCIKGEIIGGDPYFQMPLIDPTLQAESNAFIKVSYKILGATSPACSFYFTTDTISWSEDGSMQWAIDGDDEQWTEQIVDMSGSAGWAGLVDKLRYDPLSQGEDGQVIYIKYIAIFASEADATAFDFTAYKTPAAAETTAPAETTAAVETEAADTAANTTAPATTPAVQTADIFTVSIIVLSMASAAGVVLTKKSK